MMMSKKNIYDNLFEKINNDGDLENLKENIRSGVYENLSYMWDVTNNFIKNNNDAEEVRRSKLNKNGFEKKHWVNDLSKDIIHVKKTKPSNLPKYCPICGKFMGKFKMMDDNIVKKFWECPKCGENIFMHDWE